MNEAEMTGRVNGRAGELHVVVGAGAIGSEVARLLVAAGQRVRVVTRSGSGPDGTEQAAADAADATAMVRLTAGAAAVYNCVNPPYHRWPELWPPIAVSLLGAAEAAGAVLVTVSNLYAYGPASAALSVPAYDQTHPVTEQTPLAATGPKGRVRAQVWLDALQAHQAGLVRATEVRASDFIGPGATGAAAGRLVPRVLRGKPVSVLGRTDRQHTWTFTGDVARMAVVAASDPRAWGDAWHVPSNPPRTQFELAADLAEVAGVRRVPVRALPAPMIRTLGLFSPVIRELGETGYQFTQDFVLDSAAAVKTFGLEPAPWHDVLAAALRSYGWTGSARSN